MSTPNNSFNIHKGKTHRTETIQRQITIAIGDFNIPFLLSDRIWSKEIRKDIEHLRNTII